jgi:cyclic beta-1,2-glucan synthetase
MTPASRSRRRSALLARLLSRRRSGPDDVLAGPLRGELLGADRLAERARAVARGQQVVPRTARGRRTTALLVRLRDTQQILDDVHERLSTADREFDVGPAGEWLLDNRYVVQEHIREVRDSLPRGYYRELPELASGPLAGYPRAYEIATSIISHTEARIDIGNVELFVAAFQEIAPLTHGELWALPALLRMALIESVRRMALRTVQRLDEVEVATRWAGELQSAASDSRQALAATLDAFVSDHPPLTPIFVTRFLQQLRLAEEPAIPLAWIEQWIADEGLRAEDASARSSERLALTQVMTANSITSLRAVARMDWRSFVERQSGMDAELRRDPAGEYARMTFGTRDQYRHVVERISKATGAGEDEVARQAVDLASSAARDQPDAPHRAHVGYYLVDEGLQQLERLARYRPTGSEAVHRWMLRHPNLVFVGGILAGTAAAFAAVLWLAGPAARDAWPLVLLFTLLPGNEIAVTVMNQLITAFLPPRTLAKLDLREHGVPPEFRTAVVVPTLFPSVEAVREALENIEIQFLANREAHLHFAVLSDFVDSATETREDDAAIVAEAEQGVRALNARYGDGAEDAFYLFHRPRRWNPKQGVWMGWERKRGKLADFNRVVRGGAHDAFSVIIGDLDAIRSVRFVITLDSDTMLPPDAAPMLVGAMAHPLNRPVYDRESGRVVRGYGIIQPRVGVSLPSAHVSRFAAIHSGHPGVDPYTTAVSDVYQDLYGEGSFTGKGIYDVHAFEEATHARFPENTLLSHDLIEGNYARAALATDVEVYDDYPSRYLTFTRRKHRWIRGDWQLLGWLTPTVPGPDGPERNRLSVLSRWKIFDNLRRSLIEVAQLIFIVAGWTILPGSPLRWTVLGLLAVVAPWIVSLLLALSRPPLDKSWRAYYASVLRDASTSARQAGLAIVFLPHQAWISADAVVRTLWRLFVSRRMLLEWQTASQTERGTAGTAGDVWRTMWPAVALAAAVLALVLTTRWIPGGPEPQRWELGSAILPLIVIWLASPAVAHLLSRPAVRRERRLSAAERGRAMRYALLHWRFFDRFVTEDTAWLAPDNFQEDPAPVVAMRTSPTNIGLQLLSTVSAYDLGFLTVERMAERLERALRSMERLRRYRGHFYNWYDLRDLQILEPEYISTVDSGNLAGHLIALRQACLMIPDDPILDDRVWRTLRSSMALAAERLEAFGQSDVDHGASDSAKERAISDAAEHLRDARGHADGAEFAVAGLSPLEAVADALRRARQTLAAIRPEDGDWQPAIEWVEWSHDLAVEHITRIGTLVPDTVPGRGGSERAVFPTLRALAQTSEFAAELLARLEALANRSYEYVIEMDFGFLLDPAQKLFAIGHQRATNSLDHASYDLLASEARLASFIAIAKNDVPVEHWFRLGRTLTHAASDVALVSWSGSMFEYLMPALVMQSYPSTVLDQTYRGAVLRQVAYGAERDVPWGVSESAYNLRDRHQTYQYRAFGVPDLALKRGLGRDLVVAPYASALAVLVDAPRALANLDDLEQLGALGPYGFRDAIDYTRPNPDQRYAIVGNYMAHHIGMALVAFTNALTAQRWQLRFHTEPMVRAAELLLHERIPRRLVYQQPQVASADEALPDPEVERPAVREITVPDTAQPEIALLGHQKYTVMVSHCGSGYSRYESLAVTRWRADGTRDHWGQFCYVKDVTTGRAWSAAHQPTCAAADRYTALLATDRVTFHRVDGDIDTRTEITTVPDDAAEVRRTTVTNNGSGVREIELTSYGEIVLAPPGADSAHPAFGNLFIETEYHSWCTAITASRRPRSSTEPQLWCVHVVDHGKERVGSVSCETDRAYFLGRGRSTRDPASMHEDGPLAGTTGAVLDPVFALRTRVRLDPRQSASVAFTTLVASSRERAFELADRYHDPHAAQRALDLAWTAAQIELREMNLTPSDAAVFQGLAGNLFYSHAALRAPEEELRSNTGSQPLLWENGISGDWPILLATIDSADGLPTLRQLLVAHHYWRRHGMTVDLVVLNALATGYLQELQDRITATVHASSEAGVVDRPGGVFIRRRDNLTANALRMLRATARVHIACDGRSLGRILAAGKAHPSSRAVSGTPERRVYLPTAGRSSEPESPSPRALAFDNGLGGFTAQGDYEIRLSGDLVPPAPWVNVVANPFGGFIVSERGAACTWAENSLFYRLTPWHNDPVADPASDVIYLRDESSGDLWSATPAPIRHPSPYTVRHAPGMSSFEHEHAGIVSKLTLGLAPDAAVKLSVLRLTNRGEHPRRISVTAFAEWTLGVSREHTQHRIVTSFDEERGTIFARNNFDPQFTEWVAFCALSEPVESYTSDRRAFLGRNGAVSDPAAMRASELDRATGAGLDPCAALRCVIGLAPGESREVTVILGAAANRAEAERLAGEYSSEQRSNEALSRTVAEWEERLSAIRVLTPDTAFDIVVNRWLLYQALACRMWGRSALYQSSGAYGFRDQLQDSMAFVYAEPHEAREHILRAAARQFVEGDVQHWWHPHSGRGVRTKFSDDLAWLPYVVDHYVRVTGDASVLDEQAPFLTMRSLDEDEHEVYDLPDVTKERASVYEHCVRALRRACTSGAHGLPLFGIGDWNDGMNRVGVEGRGESVWLAWFLIATLRPFATLADARGDARCAAEFRRLADMYARAVEEHGWDGEWYRRGYFDDGTPLGSASSDECRIDAIAQSWSVISGAGQQSRQAQAMRSLEQHLVREDARLLMLLTPPFDQTPNDPGYIKGYLPGVRENGAQYTHGALWAVLATALRGDGDRAFELFQMINPLTHARTPAEVNTYKVEPYVVAADVYTAEGQLGRGGWTWYTGSASWMYRVAVETILGFTKRGNVLLVQPRVPASWPEFSIEYRYHGSVYAVRVLRPAECAGRDVVVKLDGRVLAGREIPLVDDGARHEVVMEPGRQA